MPHVVEVGFEQVGEIEPTTSSSMAAAVPTGTSWGLAGRAVTESSRRSRIGRRRRPETRAIRRSRRREPWGRRGPERSSERRSENPAPIRGRPPTRAPAGTPPRRSSSVPERLAPRPSTRSRTNVTAHPNSARTWAQSCGPPPASEVRTRPEASPSVADAGSSIRPFFDVESPPSSGRERRGGERGRARCRPNPRRRPRERTRVRSLATATVGLAGPGVPPRRGEARQWREEEGPAREEGPPVEHQRTAQGGRVRYDRWRSRR